MTEIMDHASTARAWLAQAVSDETIASPAGHIASKAMVARAHVHAQLAVAEQLRIGNLIALGRTYAAVPNRRQALKRDHA